MHTFFWGCWGLFIVVRSCLLSLQSKPHNLAEQATQACWTSLSGLLDKPFLLVEQVSRNVVGKSGPSSRLGTHAKGWALPSLGMCMWISWTRQWAYWAYWALFHNLSSSDCIIIGVQYALYGDLTVNMRLWGLCRLLSTFFFFFFGPARFVFCKRREQYFRFAPASKKDASHSYLISLS